MIYDELLKNDKIPRMAKVAYRIKRGGTEDVEAEIDRQLEEGSFLENIKEGDSIALTASSRDIRNLDRILKRMAEQIKSRGGLPFIVPAMGSHGGATARGQEEVLAGYGITQETTGAPVCSSMETVQVGISESGLPVCIDKYAAKADGIVVIGRIKPHTDFHGKVESGLMKMMAIGLGKQHGASICHKRGFKEMPRNILEFGRVILENTKVLFGVGIIEDFFHNTYKIEIIPAKDIEEREAQLLLLAKSLIPRIPFAKVDVLAVQEIGKNISGAGMDPNVTGRSGQMGISEPFAESIVVFDITEKSHHNGAGIGLADVTTRRAFEKIDFEATYPNGITACDVSGMKIPPVMPNDRLALKHAIHLVTCTDNPDGIRMVWIKNTCSMDCFYISESLMEEAKSIQGIQILTDSEELKFDQELNLIADW